MAAKTPIKYEPVAQRIASYLDFTAGEYPNNAEGRAVRMALARIAAEIRQRDALPNEPPFQP